MFLKHFSFLRRSYNIWSFNEGEWVTKILPRFFWKIVMSPYSIKKKQQNKQKRKQKNKNKKKTDRPSPYYMSFLISVLYMWLVCVTDQETAAYIQLVWALQEFSARNCELVVRNCESIPLRGISCASGERLAALAFRLRRTLAPSALALRARFFSRLRRSYLGQLPKIESLTKTNMWQS